MNWRKSYEAIDVVHALRRRAWLVILPFVLAAGATTVVTHRLPNRFESDVRIQLIPANVTVTPLTPGTTATTAAALQSRLPAIETLVLNPARLRQVAEDLKLYRANGTRVSGEPVTQIRSNLRVRVDSLDSFVVTYTAANAATARAVAERLGDAFVDENRIRAEAAAGAAGDFLDTQLSEARARLEATEGQIAEYNTQHAGELPSQLQTNLQMQQTAQMQLQAVRDALGRDRDEAAVLERAIAEADAGQEATLDDKAGTDKAVTPRASAKQELETARRDLREMESHLKPEHPDVQRAKRHVAALEVQAEAAEAVPPAEPAPVAADPVHKAPQGNTRGAQLRTALATLGLQLKGRQREEARLLAQIEDYRRRIEATPENDSGLTALTRDYGTLKDMYGRLLGRKEDARLAAKLQGDEIGERFVIASPATMPTGPSSPNRLQLNLAGSMAGLILGLLLVAGTELRDGSLRTARDIEVALQLPLLATIPVLATRGDRARRPSAMGGRLEDLLTQKTVAAHDLDPAARSQYEKLATALHHAQGQSGIKTVIISSATQGEGKSLTAVNLALTLSRSFRKRVLLVDADLRRPTLHTFFGQPLSPGLADVLKETAGALVTGAGPFVTLSAGVVVDPVGSLSGARLGEVLKQAAQAFDWVIVDSPPVGMVPDARLVAAHSDGVLLVVAAGATPNDLVQNAVDAFTRGHVLGVVLNRAERHAVGGGSYYAYYGGADEKHR